MQPKIVYSPEYDIHFWGLERMHPFDSRKYSRAWNELQTRFDGKLEAIDPQTPASREHILLVHSEDYLEHLQSASYVAKVLEIGLLAMLPYQAIEERLLQPMRLATHGTIIAAEHALQSGVAINMAGGYHHASRDKGEGFCVYADVAIAIEHLRQTGTLGADDTVMIIDLDAHQGNGYERIYHDQQKGVYIFDMFNRSIYPNDRFARERIDYPIMLPSYTTGEDYLHELHQLEQALEQADNPRLAFYLAGTDIYEHDQLGQLRVSEADVLKRDQYVFDTLRQHNVPVVMLLAGGYSQDSYRLIANAIEYVLTG